MLITGDGVETTSARMYTMRELSQRTAQVIEEINDSGARALLTKHGRPIALITPLRDAEVESMVLGRPGPIRDALQDRINDTSQRGWSSEEVEARIRQHYDADDEAGQTQAPAHAMRGQRPKPTGRGRSSE